MTPSPHHAPPSGRRGAVGRRWLHALGAAVLALCLAVTPARAQAPDPAPRYTIALRDVPLDDALQQFIRRTGTDIAYSNELVAGRRVYCRARDASAEALLRCILAGTGVDYLLTSGGTYLLVDAFRAPDAVGRLAGTVVDAATGEPLPQANVLLADAATGTATNQAGRFALSSVLAGTHQLVVTYVGYAPYADSVWVPADGRRTVRVALDPQPFVAEPLIVDGLQQRLPSTGLGRNRLGPGGLERVTGVGTPDVIRSASRQVGVSLNRPRADLHVQGGGAGEHVTLLDGVPVREPVSLGGLLSAFSPQALGRITVHKAGFAARHGSYTAGLVATEHDLARSSTRYAATSADPVSLNARAEIGWNGSSHRAGRAMVAARTSVWGAYRSPALHHRLSAWVHPDPTLTARWLDPGVASGRLLTQHPTADVRFADLHAAWQQALSPFHRLYASAYHGTNRMGTDVASVLTGREAPHLLATRSRTGWDNTMLQLRYEGLLSARVSSVLQLHGSRHDSHTFFGLRDSLLPTTPPAQPFDPPSPDALTDHADEGNALDEWGGRAEIDVSLSPRYRLSASVTPQHLRGRVHVRNRFLGAIDHRINRWQIGGHVEGDASFGVGTTLTAGTRLTYLPARQSVYAEPRLALRHDRPATPVGDLAVRLAGGLYRQYVVQSEISTDGPLAVVPSMQFWLPLDGSLAPPRAYHAAAEVLAMPSAAWAVRLETYYKWQPRTLQIDYAGLVHTTPLASAQAAPVRVLGQQADFMAAGAGRAYGAALRVQYDGPRLAGDVTAELGRAQRRYPNRFDERFVPAPWEQPVRLAANLDVRLAGGLHALGSWQASWGRSWALRRAYYDYAALTAGGATLSGFDLSRPGDQVLAPFSRFDVGLKAERRLRGVTVEARLNMVNVFDRANPFDWSLDTAGAQAERLQRTLPGRRLFVLLGLRY